MSFESHFNKYWDSELKKFILQHKDKSWNSNFAYINNNISWELFNDPEVNKHNIYTRTTYLRTSRLIYYSFPSFGTCVPMSN